MSKHKIGIGTIVEEGAVIGEGVEIGDYCLIRKGVEIGAGTRVESYVELRAGTRVGRDCVIDSGVKSSGNCTIGDRVTLRYETIIARGCEIGDGCYLSPRVMTNNLDSEKRSIGGARLEPNVFVGTQAVLHYGVSIGQGAIVGAMAFVNKDVAPRTTVVGVPALPVGTAK